MTYEILVFKGHDIYRNITLPKKDAKEEFIRVCREFINPDEIDKEDTSLWSGDKYIRYTHYAHPFRSSVEIYNPPKMIMLLGELTEECRKEVLESLGKFYNNCEDCGESIETGYLCLSCKTKD
jgi:hypothetical protein